jgi:hypothetical protein
MLSALRWSTVGLTIPVVLATCSNEWTQEHLIEAVPPIRLIDHLAAVEIESPLGDVAPTDFLLTERGGLGPTKSWSTDFRNPGADLVRGCRPLEAGGLECDKGPEGFLLRVSVRCERLVTWTRCCELGDGTGSAQPFTPGR